jgi:hypothetical protein
MDNQEKLATLGTQDTRRKQTKQNTQHNMCWTSNCVVLLTVYYIWTTISLRCFHIGVINKKKMYGRSNLTSTVIIVPTGLATGR